MGSFRLLDNVSLDQLLAEAQHEPGGRAMDEIMRRFEPLTRKIARSMSSNLTMQDDLMNEARLALFLAVGRHDLSRAGFPRYAEVTMRGAALRWSQGWSKRDASRLEDVDEPAAAEPADEDWAGGLVAEIVRSLPDRQRHLLEARYVDDAGLATIAKADGVSESAVSQRLRTACNAVLSRLAA
jgi:RNA polymerase sigma factor (sigma-70 family)